MFSKHRFEMLPETQAQTYIIWTEIFAQGFSQTMCNQGN